MSTTSTCPLNVSKKTDFIDMFKECIDIQDTAKGTIAERTDDLAKTKRGRIYRPRIWCIFLLVSVQSTKPS